jgi:hypothetical protein
MSDEIKTRPATDAYREGWERTFGKHAKLRSFTMTMGETAARLGIDPSEWDSAMLRVDAVLPHPQDIGSKP